MLCQSTGASRENQSFLIDRQNYKDGYTIFCFDIQKANGSHGALQLEKHGNVSIELKFQQALSEAVNIIIYSESTRVMQVDKNRQIE